MSFGSDTYTKSLPRARMAPTAIAVASPLNASCGKPLNDLHDPKAGLTTADDEVISGASATEAPPMSDLMPSLAVPRLASVKIDRYNTFAIDPRPLTF